MPVQAPRVVRLEEIEGIPGPGSLTWHPVRYTLDIRAFGCNAYTADEAGKDVVEPHTEDPDLAHEELYFVAAGHAAFTIDGEQHDAPAGTYVFVPSPASHRAAVAVEPGTTVLSFGGPPTFKPSAWEWAWRAARLAREDPARARKIVAEGLAEWPESPSLHYTRGCIEALSGDPDDALAALAAAAEANRAAVRRWAAEDSDLDSLRGDPRFRELLEA